MVEGNPESGVSRDAIDSETIEDQGPSPIRAPYGIENFREIVKMLAERGQRITYVDVDLEVEPRPIEKVNLTGNHL